MTNDCLPNDYSRQAQLGRLAQLVRALPSHGRGHKFESCIAHSKTSRSELIFAIVAASKSSVTELAVAESSAKMIPVGSVLIAMYGASIGKTGITGVECCTNQAIAHCIPDPDLMTSDFLVLLLQSLKSMFIDLGRGAAQPNISQTIIKAFEVSVPCITDQAVIVSTFDSMMAMCDELETQLQHRGDLSSRLAISSTRLAG